MVPSSPAERSSGTSSWDALSFGTPSQSGASSGILVNKVDMSDFTSSSTSRSGSLEAPPSPPPPTAYSTAPYHPWYSDLQHTTSAAYHKALHDVVQLQYVASQWLGHAPGAAGGTAAPIIIQNHALAETQVKQEETEQNHNGVVPPPQTLQPSSGVSWSGRMHAFVTGFWGSRLNRILVIGIVGFSVYFIWEWRRHRYRLALIQRHIDAHPLLKLTHILAERKQASSPHYRS